jgi:predicted nuclease of predicted toxin-antitoxin system
MICERLCITRRAGSIIRSSLRDRLGGRTALAGDRCVDGGDLRHRSTCPARSRPSGRGEIYLAARGAGAVVLTKDGDFAQLQAHLGPPPKVIWLRCGNTSNARLREILVASFPQARLLLEGAESLVEITAT